MRVAERGEVNDPVLASRWMSLSPRREETASEFSLRVSRTTEPPDGGLLREAFLGMSKSIDQLASLPRPAPSCSRLRAEIEPTRGRSCRRRLAARQPLEIRLDRRVVERDAPLQAHQDPRGQVDHAR